jgi:hypothetical protein
MKMNNRTIIALLALLVFISSCSRAITPYEAAHGKAKCGRFLR